MSDEDSDTEICPFLEESHLTDVALVVEDKKLFVNKAILAVASPVFNTMFYSDFKEKDAKEIPLPDKKYEDMVAFLKRIYPDCTEPLTIDITTQVLPLLHEYDCKRQMLECEQFLTTTKDLKKKDFDPEKLLLCLMQSKMFGLEDAYKLCLSLTPKYSLESLRSTKIFRNIQDSVRAELYFKKIMLLKSKITNMIENECKYCPSTGLFNNCSHKSAFIELRDFI